MGALGYTLVGTSGSPIGQAVAGGGNVDGAGNDDILLFGNSVIGEISSVFSPGSNGTVAAQSSATSFTDGLKLYSSSAVVGDVAGDDGKAEVLVAGFSKFHLLNGSDAWPANDSAIVTPPAPGPHNAWSSATRSESGEPSTTAAGDFDGENGPDFAYCDGGETCQVVQGTDPPDLTTGLFVVNFVADVAPRVAGGGDTNGDGLNELLFAEDTAAYLVWGQSPLSLTNLDVGSLGTRGAPINPKARVLGDVAVLGDVNGDGLADYALAVPNHDGGKGRVYVIFGVLTEN
jgi:hypothetical protein